MNREYFRTLRGFLDGDEPDEDNYFAYSATLRIFGVLPDLQLITDTLGLTPKQALHKGQRIKPGFAPLKHDCWHYSPDIPESEPLEDHINALWAAIKDHRDFIKGLNVLQRWTCFWATVRTAIPLACKCRIPALRCSLSLKSRLEFRSSLREARRGLPLLSGQRDWDLRNLCSTGKYRPADALIAAAGLRPGVRRRRRSLRWPRSRHRSVEHIAHSTSAHSSSISIPWAANAVRRSSSGVGSPKVGNCKPHCTNYIMHKMQRVRSSAGRNTEN